MDLEQSVDTLGRDLSDIQNTLNRCQSHKCWSPHFRFRRKRHFQPDAVGFGFDDWILHLGRQEHRIAFAERHRRFVRALEHVDDAVGGWPVLRGAGDHFLIVLRKAL